MSSLKLPMGGLTSDGSTEDVSRALQNLNDSATALGCRLDTPFMTLSFLTIPVILELRLTDKGLIDVVKQRRVSLFA
ncbi:MAG: adenine deaminase C-terminal domain-containing protein [Candidatus Thermoplasmatota archaeon]|nr:adenine deaminase C-terminal domain-containing protein [Candidatus Thermoplasmatota archaeon]